MFFSFRIFPPYFLYLSQPKNKPFSNSEEKEQAAKLLRIVQSIHCQCYNTLFPKIWFDTVLRSRFIISRFFLWFLGLRLEIADTRSLVNFFRLFNSLLLRFVSFHFVSLRFIGLEIIIVDWIVCGIARARVFTLLSVRYPRSLDQNRKW